MDELTAVCGRLLGVERAAAECAERAFAAGDDRIARLRAALEACRGSDALPAPAAPERDAGLRATVAAELQAAAGTLPSREREALALREVAGLSHAELGAVLGVEPAAATALLIRARLGLRGALRSTTLPRDDCPERERALRTITLRLDGERVAGADEDWLIEHVGHCPGCRRAHATLLESAACYRGWPSPVASSAPAPSTPPAPGTPPLPSTPPAASGMPAAAAS